MAKVRVYGRIPVRDGNYEGRYPMARRDMRKIWCHALAHLG